MPINPFIIGRSIISKRHHRRCVGQSSQVHIFVRLHCARHGKGWGDSFDP